jgi:hypothetical protein
MPDKTKKDHARNLLKIGDRCREKHPQVSSPLYRAAVCELMEEEDPCPDKCEARSQAEEVVAEDQAILDSINEEISDEGCTCP